MEFVFMYNRILLIAIQAIIYYLINKYIETFVF